MKRRYIKPETEVFSDVWLEPMMQAVSEKLDEETGDWESEARESFLEPEEEETPGIYKRNLWED